MWDLRFAQVKEVTRKRQMKEHESRITAEHRSSEDGSATSDTLDPAAGTKESIMEDREPNERQSTVDASNGAAEESDPPDVQKSSTNSIDTTIDTNDEEFKIVCRPRVGDLTAGGGFLGVFKKTT